MNKALAAWNRLAKKPLGKALFSRAVCFKAPYFATINPRFEELRPGYARVSMKKRRAVTNHIGTVHAIAMCNLAELAAGTLTEVSIPNRGLRVTPSLPPTERAASCLNSCPSAAFTSSLVGM